MEKQRHIVTTSVCSRRENFLPLVAHIEVGVDGGTMGDGDEQLLLHHLLRRVARERESREARAGGREGVGVPKHPRDRQRRLASPQLKFRFARQPLPT